MVYVGGGYTGSGVDDNIIQKYSATDDKWSYNATMMDRSDSYSNVTAQ